MGKIIDFPVKKTIYTCGQCKVFEWCYAQSNNILGRTDTSDREKCKKIPACDKIEL